MKRLVSLLVVLGLLACPLAKAWESAVHAKGVQDICKALGFTEEQAIRVGDGAWFDGSDIRMVRKDGRKEAEFYRNQDRVFNTGVWEEGAPVKTYGKFTVSPNDTRYLNAQKYLNRAIRLVKEGKKDEAFFALGVGVRALQNIFANRDVVNDAAWTVQGRMTNGASAWVPGMTFDTAWHNANHEDDVFGEAHSDALYAALRATADYVGDFLTACPQAVENVKRLPSSAVEGIVKETLSLVPVKKNLTRTIQDSGRDIMARIDKALTTLPTMNTAADVEKLPPRALTFGPAHRLAAFAKLAFRQQVELVRSDVDEFTGSADVEWKALVKATEESLVELRKSADNVSEALTEASAAWKTASPEDGYAVVRRRLVELSTAVFTSLKSYMTVEQLFDRQVVYWVDVLQGQMKEYALHHEIELARIYHTLKAQLPNTETAFADFMAASEAAVKEYTGRCENALADFNEAMAAIANAYGKEADGLKQSAAERVSAVSAAFDEKAKQAAESLRGIAPLKRGDEVPKAVEDVIRNLMKDASDLKDNASMNIAPSLSDNRHDDVDPQKIRRHLAAHVFRQDFPRPIDIGSIRPDSWEPAVWKGDGSLEITLVRRPPIYERDLTDFYDKGKSLYDKGKDIKTAKDYYDRISKEGATREIGHDIIGEVGGKIGGKATGKILIKGGELAGKLIGGRFGPAGAKIGKTIGHVGADLLNDVAGDWIGEHTSTAIDWAFGEGTSDALADKIVYGLEKGEEVVDKVDGVIGEVANDGLQLLTDGWQDIKDTWNNYFGDDAEDDIKNRVDDFTNNVNDICDHLNMDHPLDRQIAMDQIEILTDKFMAPFRGFLDKISSLTLQIRGFMLNIINMAVDIEHIDISSEMDESLRVLTNDLNVMMGKDTEQDKDVKRKATIENKGRDLKRQSNPGRDLKGAPGVKQIEMN